MVKLSAAAVAVMIASPLPAAAGPSMHPFVGSPLFVEVVVVRRDIDPYDEAHDPTTDNANTRYAFQMVGTPIPAPGAVRILEVTGTLVGIRFEALRRPQRLRPFAIGQHLVAKLEPATQRMCQIHLPCDPPATTKASLVGVISLVEVADHDEAAVLLDGLAVDNWPADDTLGAPADPRHILDEIRGTMFRRLIIAAFGL